MSFTIKVANFDGRRAGEMVPWVSVDTGDCKGAKRGKSGQGINPHLILSILDGDQDHLRKVCLKAIAEASPVPVSPVAKKSIAEVTQGFYYGWDGSKVLPLMDTDAARHLALTNEDALFSTPADKENWLPASDFGLDVAESLPTGPSAPKKPEVASGVVEPADKQAILDRIKANRGQRVLSAK